MNIQQVSLLSKVLTPEEISHSFSMGTLNQEKITEVIVPYSSIGTILDASNNIISALQLTESIKSIFSEDITNTILCDADLNEYLTKLNRVIETIQLQDTPATISNLIERLTNILEYDTTIKYLVIEHLTDVIAIDINVASRLSQYLSIVETLLFEDVLSNPGITITVTDNYVFDDDINSYAILKNIIEDGLSFLGTVNFDGQSFLAHTVVYNTQSGGISEYSNFQFNSYDYPLAAAEDGIYSLEGDTDNGSAISASIKTGLMDFGTSLKKQVPYAYIGITQEGQILLKTISNNVGIKKERWYKVTTKNTNLDTVRIQIGKGVKAKYWQFELNNINGDDFNINSLELTPLILKRRIQ